MNFKLIGLCSLSLLCQGFIHPSPYEDKDLIYQPIWGPGNYLRFAHLFDSNKIRLIIEIGSRDALDAIFLGHFYQCPVYAFECHPEGLKICYHNVKKYPYVTVVPFACWNATQRVPFYPIIESHGSKSHPVNIGASSLLMARKDSCDPHHIQGDPIYVQAIRLDEWMTENCIEEVDLLCMDAEGTTLQVLQGMGKFLEKVKYIITEVFESPAYVGEALYPEIRQFLTARGFRVVEEPRGYGFSDVVFIKKTD